MSRRTSPFRPGMVLALLLVGTFAFGLLLYALGHGWTGGQDRDGGNHAAANGLNGYSGLATLLQRTGSEVSVSRNPADLQEYGLQVLTPPLMSSAEEIDEIVRQRMDRAAGPTLLILPKWMAMPVPAIDVESETGWVTLLGAMSPPWFAELEFAEGAELAIGQTGGWQGLGAAGDLPDQTQVQALVTDSREVMRPLLVDDEGDVLAAQLVQPGSVYSDTDPWPIVIVFEPDLMNNYGMADIQRAQIALQLVERATLDKRMPIRFDLSLNGLGATENLLTLALRPPFLAATLCLLLAALVIGWRAFRRFGPALVEPPAVSQGKRQLARNGAALLQRVKRWHLLKGPYEDMIARRVASTLGLRRADPVARETAIDKALARRGYDGQAFTRLARNLREAQRPRDILRAARRLRTFERTLTQ